MNLAIYRVIVERSMGNKQSSKHNSVPLEEALNYLSSRRYVLPSFQHNYVWKMEQIEELFNSIRLGYPFGTLLLWRINIDSDANVLQNESFYTFIQHFCEDKNNTSQQKWSLLPGNDYWVVLDGQQRLTSLNIGLLGSYSKRARYQRKNNPDYPEYRLYMLISEDVENPFRFIKNEESHLAECFTELRTGKKWLLVRTIFYASRTRDLVRPYALSDQEEDRVDRFKDNLNKLNIDFAEITGFDMMKQQTSL